MNIDKLLIIPDARDMRNYIELSREYGVGFEYNDFFWPASLDTKGFIDDRIQMYRSVDGLPEYSTMHGAFLDVTIFSDDPEIIRVSDYRVEQSLSIAERMGCDGVVFHTNYIANFRLESYRENWLKRNEAYWKDKCSMHPGINIYVENMFDDEPDLLAGLGGAMKDIKNFGICFDYAHAHVFGDETRIEDWVQKLAPFVRHIHINDNDFKQDSHLALGDGLIDWEGFRYHYLNYMSSASVLIEVSTYDKALRSLKYIDRL